MNSDFRAATSSAPGSCFDDVLLPHLGAAGRLWRRLVGEEHEA